jgi:hypothetical protein
MSEQYFFFIDLEERGVFKAHVEDDEGDTVYEINSEDDEDGQVWLVEAGYMRNLADINGLHNYLVDMDFMPPGSSLDWGN